VATSLAAAACAATAPAPLAIAQAPARGPAAPPFPVTRAAPDKGDRPAPAGLAALRIELDRAMATLGKADPPVHNLAYTVTFHEDEQLSAAYGGIEGDSHREQRSLDVDLRVGADAFDSNHSSRRIAPVRGHWETLPLDDTDPLAARQVAWNATDRAYKDAVERFVSLKNQREVQAEDEDKSADFSTETPARYIGEPAPPLGIDVAAWKTRLRALSARFEGEKEIHESHVALQATRRTRWFLSSDGTTVQYGARSYRVVVTASTQADDGMPLGLFKSFEAWTPAGLPDDAAVAASIAEMTTNLKALRRAPLAEPFTGPAILEGRAEVFSFTRSSAIGSRRTGSAATATARRSGRSSTSR
jgi:hypothetical protein